MGQEKLTEETTQQTEIDDRDKAAPSIESDGHPRWQVTLYTMWVSQLLAIVGFSFVMPFIPFYIRDLGVRDPKALPIWAGILTTAAGVTMSLAAPLWGTLADRFGRKPMVQRAMFGGAVILSLMGLAKNVYQMLGLRLLQGAITGTVPASVALVASVVPKRRVGFSLGLMQMAVFSGASIGPFLGGLMAERLGYRIPFGVTGGLLFSAGLLVLFGAKERFKRPTREAQENSVSLRQVFLTTGVPMLLGLYMMLNLSGSFVGPIFPLFVEQISQDPSRAASQTGIVLAVSGIMAAAASLLVGRMSDRLGHKRVLVFCTALAGLMCFPQAAAKDVWQLLAMRVVFGIGAGGMIPAMNALMSTMVPRESLGRAYGLTTTSGSLGMAAGPILGGWAASALGFRLPFVIMGGLLVLLASALSRQRAREATD